MIKIVTGDKSRILSVRNSTKRTEIPFLTVSNNKRKTILITRDKMTKSDYLSLFSFPGVLCVVHQIKVEILGYIFI